MNTIANDTKRKRARAAGQALDTMYGRLGSGGNDDWPFATLAEVAIPKYLFADIMRFIAELRLPPDAAPA